MTHAGADGECMRCLVSFGFLSEEEQARGTGSKTVRQGPLRYAHFEVEVNSDGYPKILGAGAMAVTYCARDTILNSTVALKVITRKLAEDETARARFLREARAAAQIHNPNVARVIHYGEQDGECFYAMELVHGETLEERVQREGPLPLDVALEVVEQTARGLAAGEACGVIHRDLKPSNLMIESQASGHILIKIIDYGVAKVMAGDTLAQTQAGFIGTPAFASPEQFNEAGVQQIDTRSDIYSLGVVFWYLLTGRTPFAGKTLEEVRASQIDPLPLEQLKAARVPREVVGLIKSMLAVDPASRPQTARELLSHLDICCRKFEPRARARRHHWLIGAAAASIIAFVAATATLWYQNAHSVAEMERSIAILPFENRSPDDEEAFFAIGMQDELGGQLGRLPGIKVIGTQSTRNYPASAPRDLRKIARELSVKHLLEGTVWRAHDQLRISLHLIEPDRPDKTWDMTYERPMKEVFALQAEIARAIAAQLQTRIPSSVTAALDTPPTTDLQAYDLYLQAITLPKLFKNSTEQFQSARKCISLLQQAVARDPNFVAAYCEMAEMHDVLYRIRQVLPAEERTVDHRALAETALAAARRIQPDAGRVHLAWANHFYSTQKDLEQAHIEVELARRIILNSADLEITAAVIARGQGRWDEAIRCFEKAVSLEPRQNVNYFLLASTHRLLRHYEDFDRLMGQVIDMMPPADSAAYRVFRSVGSMERDGNAAHLRAALGTVSQEQDPDGKIRDLHNVLLALADHDPDAVSRALAPASDSSFVFNGVAYPKTWYEGLAARIRGDDGKAQEAFRFARLEVDKAVFADAADARALSLLAMIDAGLNRREDALREARQACELASFANSAMNAPIVRCNLAVVYAWTGDRDSAIRELEQIVGKPAGSNLPAQPTYGDFLLNPLWDPLRNDPRFDKVVATLKPKA